MSPKLNFWVLFCSLQFFFYSQKRFQPPWEVFIQHLTSFFNKRQKKGTTLLQKEGENSTLTDGWWNLYFCIIKMLLALDTEISNIHIFFINKKKDVVIYSNIQDNFASSNLKCHLKNKKNKIFFKIEITKKKKILKIVLWDPGCMKFYHNIEQSSPIGRQLCVKM